MEDTILLGTGLLHTREKLSF